MDVMEYGNPAASIVLIQPIDARDADSIESEIAAIRAFSGEEFRLNAFRVDNWNKDLSPWQAPAVFGKEEFGNGAADTLAEIVKFCGDRTKTYYLGGYSLAGLFALWAACQTDIFSGIAAASPSVWFPGFADYMKDHPIKSNCVYLSLGKKEEKARNPVMAAVGDRMREVYDHLTALDIRCILEWNEGNHFRDADLRTAKAFAWVMKQKRAGAFR